MTSVVTLCILPNDTYPEAGTIAYPPLLPQSSFCCFSTLVFLLSSPLMEAYSLYPRFSNSHYGLVVKKPLANAGDAGLIPGSGRFPEEGNGNPLQYSCLENPLDKGASCPWGHKELDMTERLHSLNGPLVFPTLFNLSLNLAIRST